MKSHYSIKDFTKAVFLVVNLLILSLLINLVSISGFPVQSENTIGGFVFDPQRKPIADAVVELLDDFSRTVGRTRTNASGRYFFSRIKAGRYKVKVLSLGINYQEQEQDVEIQNLIRDTNAGLVVSGLENVQKDFYLRQKKPDALTGKTEAIFVQEIPPQAADYYKKAIDILTDNNKANDMEAWKLLKNSIEIFPDYFDALKRLGLEYINGKHYLPAQLLLMQAVKINPRSEESWYGLAYSLYYQKKNTEAIEALGKANSLNSESVQTNLLMGTLLRRLGRYAEALKPLLKAKKLAKGAVPDVHWQLALLYGNELKMYAEAAEELETFLSLQQNSKNAEAIKKLIADFKAKAGSKV